MARSRSAVVPMALLALAACSVVHLAFVPPASQRVEHAGHEAATAAALAAFAGAAVLPLPAAAALSPPTSPVGLDFRIVAAASVALIAAAWSFFNASEISEAGERRIAREAAEALAEAKKAAVAEKVEMRRALEALEAGPAVAEKAVAPTGAPNTLPSEQKTADGSISLGQQAAQAGVKAAAADEEPKTLPSKEETADGSIALGQQVSWNGKKATVRYIGDVKFAAGEWVGLELAEAGGVHDGNVFGVPYFQCPAGKGVFAQPMQLSGSTAMPASAPSKATVPTTVVAMAAENQGPTTLPSKEMTADGSISLGQQVTWNGKTGMVRYIGDVRFAKGEWLGVELTDAKGMHDGTVLGVPYFECQAGMGVFAQLVQLSGSGAAPSTVPAAPLPPAIAAAMAPTASENLGSTPLPSKETTTDSSIALGQQVMWNGKNAVVRYIGDVGFSKGEWLGLELMDAGGVHDGNVLGVCYFECPAGKGVFAQPAQLSGSGVLNASATAAAPVAVGSTAQMAMSAMALEDEGPTTLPSKDMTADSSVSLGQKVMWNGKAANVRYIGDVKFAKGEWVGLELAGAGGVHDGSVMGVPYFECPAGKGVFAQPAQLSGSGVPPASMVAPTAMAASTSEDDEVETFPSKQKIADGSISLGQQIIWNGKSAMVRYIGDVKFAEGEWLGLELTDGNGVHDGSVMGVPYFQCPAGKGVFAEPARLTDSSATPASAGAPTAVAVMTPERHEVETLPSKEKSAHGSVWLGQQVMWKGNQGIVRYIGDVGFATGEWVGVEMFEATGMHDGTALGVPYFRCLPGRGIFTQPAQLQTTGTGDSAVVEQTLRQAEASATAGTLRVDQRVTWSGKHAGTVRYVGPVTFAAGEFVGVELDDAAGRHDGSFMGESYFECEFGKGIFSQASMLKALTEPIIKV